MHRGKLSSIINKTKILKFPEKEHKMIKEVDQIDIRLSMILDIRGKGNNIFKSIGNFIPSQIGYKYILRFIKTQKAYNLYALSEKKFLEDILQQKRNNFNKIIYIYKIMEGRGTHKNLS